MGQTGSLSCVFEAMSAEGGQGDRVSRGTGDGIQLGGTARNRTANGGLRVAYLGARIELAAQPGSLVTIRAFARSLVCGALHQ